MWFIQKSQCVGYLRIVKEFSHIVCCVKIIFYLQEPFWPNTGFPEYVEITWLIIPKAGKINMYTSGEFYEFSPQSGLDHIFVMITIKVFLNFFIFSTSLR